MASIRSVCPVGAMSTTIDSNRVSLPARAISISAATSSMPGSDSWSNLDTSSAIEPCAAQRNLFECRPASAQPTVERLLRVDLGGVQRPAADRDTSRADESGSRNASPSDGAGSVEMTRVSVPFGGGGDGNGGCAGRLSDAALSADEVKAR